MTGIKPYLIAAALCLCTLLGGSVVWVYTRDTLHRLQDANTALSGQVKALRVANTALLSQSETRAARNAATAARTKERSDALDNALKANPTWAAQRVPDDVAAALGVYGPASSAEPASGP